MVRELQWWFIVKPAECFLSIKGPRVTLKSEAQLSWQDADLRFQWKPLDGTASLQTEAINLLFLSALITDQVLLCRHFTFSMHYFIHERIKQWIQSISFLQKPFSSCSLFYLFKLICHCCPHYTNGITLPSSERTSVALGQHPRRVHRVVTYTTWCCINCRNYISARSVITKGVQELSEDDDMHCLMSLPCISEECSALNSS